VNETLPSFLKQSGDSILFKSDGELYFYIPEKYFDLKVAEYQGDCISLLGIFSYALKENNKMSTLRQFNYPTRFVTKPYKVEKLKSVKLIKESKPEDYRVLCYKKDDVVIVDINVPVDMDNAEDLINLFIIGGHISNTIPYDKIQNYFIDNISYNDNDYGISLQLFGIVIGELCRSTKDVSKPFRLTGSTNMHDYKSISIIDIARLVSPYSAISSNNFNQALVYASVNKNKITSPLERVLTGEDV